jgi:hypothetical protein
LSLDRFEGRNDILRPPDFDWRDFEAERASRGLDLGRIFAIGVVTAAAIGIDPPDGAADEGEGSAEEADQPQSRMHKITTSLLAY